MINKLDYRVLMTFGGGKYNTLIDSFGIARHRTRGMTLERYVHTIHKILSYGWISGETDGLPVVNYKARFGITQKGSDAMEFYKQMRYHNTDKKAFLSKEGRAMITLPNQRYNSNVYIEKSS